MIPAAFSPGGRKTLIPQGSITAWAGDASEGRGRKELLTDHGKECIMIERRGICRKE
jgi:hypothetical protein